MRVVDNRPEVNDTRLVEDILLGAVFTERNGGIFLRYRNGAINLTSGQSVPLTCKVMNLKFLNATLVIDGEQK